MDRKTTETDPIDLTLKIRNKKTEGTFPGTPVDKSRGLRKTCELRTFDKGVSAKGFSVKRAARTEYVHKKEACHHPVTGNTSDLISSQRKRSHTCRKLRL